MEPFYEYYIVQVETAFVANDYCEEPLTEDEEEAFAFTRLADAQICAHEVDGTVVRREVSERELLEMEQTTIEEIELQQLCLGLAAF